MNPESLLHEAAELLRTEAERGPGTMFLLLDEDGLIVTRTPGNVPTRDYVAQYRCENFNKGLTSTQWAGLLKKLWTAHEARQKGAAGEQQPAKKP